MTKDQLQKEIKEKVKPGIKPSQLKRSKSAGDIPKASPLLSVQTTALTRSKSSEVFNDPKYPFTTLISQQEELETLRKETKAKSSTIDLLRKKNEALEKEVEQIRTSFTEQLSKLAKLESLEKELSQKQEQNDALLVKLAETMEELNKVKEASSS